MSSSNIDIDETQRIPLVCPPWDRRVDLTWSREHGIKWTGPRELTAFRTSVAQFHRESGHVPTQIDLFHPLFKLPDRVRYMICKHLVPDAPVALPIKLNNGTRHYEPVWPAVFFDNLGDVLAAVADYTSVCWALRADILMTIMNTRTFHIVLSPFSGPMLDPIAHHWFDQYGTYIQQLTIELDYTKLGFGKEAAAAMLKPLVTKLTPRLERFAEGKQRRTLQQELLVTSAGFFNQAERTTVLRSAGGRGGLTTIHKLTVAARRYYGERPAEAGRVPQKYSADEYLAVLAPLKALCGKVEVMRAVGLDADSAHRLLALVWEGMTAESVQAVAAARFGAVRATCPSDLYPTLPGQASRFDDGTGETSAEGVLVRHPSAFEDGRLGFYLDESMVADGKKGTVRAHSSVPGSALGKGKARMPEKVGGLPGLASGLFKGKGKGKETEREREQMPMWPEEREDSGSSTEAEPFPDMPAEAVQHMLLAAYEVDRAVGQSVERCPSLERQQGEAGEESMPGPSTVGRRVGRMVGRLQREMSRLNLEDASSSKE